MGYETKVILKAVVSIMKKSKDLDEAIRFVTVCRPLVFPRDGAMCLIWESHERTVLVCS